MASLSPERVYENLAQLDQSNLLQSACYREQAQEVLGDASVSLQWRQAIAERLNRANHLLALTSVSAEESY